MKDTLYVVYHVTHNNEIVYIGYGDQTRPLHATSGISGNYHLNRLHHTGETVTTDIVFTTTDRDLAKIREKQDIINFKPIYNTVYVTSERQEAVAKSKIMRDHIQDVLKSLDRNAKSTDKIRGIFDKLLRMFTTTQLIIGVNIKGLPGSDFNQLRRLPEKHREVKWYSTLMATGLIEINKDSYGNVFLKILV